MNDHYESDSDDLDESLTVPKPAESYVSYFLLRSLLSKVYICIIFRTTTLLLSMKTNLVELGQRDGVRFHEIWHNLLCLKKFLMKSELSDLN